MYSIYFLKYLFLLFFSIIKSPLLIQGFRYLFAQKKYLKEKVMINKNISHSHLKRKDLNFEKITYENFTCFKIQIRKNLN